MSEEAGKPGSASDAPINGVYRAASDDRKDGEAVGWQRRVKGGRLRRSLRVCAAHRGGAQLMHFRGREGFGGAALSDVRRGEQGPCPMDLA